MCLKKHLRLCECPQPSPDIEIKPIRSSPMDEFGFSEKCCYCIPLKSAVIFIGIITLVWSTFQLIGADKMMSNIFSERKIPFTCSKIFLIIAALLLMISCGILFVAMAMHKFLLYNIFLWYGFVYNCLSVVLAVTLFTVKIMETEKKFLKHITRVIIMLSWNCLFLYFLIIVNSFKLMTTLRF